MCDKSVSLSTLPYLVRYLVRPSLVVYLVYLVRFIRPICSIFPCLLYNRFSMLYNPLHWPSPGQLGLLYVHKGRLDVTLKIRPKYEGRRQQQHAGGD